MSDEMTMTIEAFEIAMTRWGADLTEWPSDARSSAEALLSASPEARALQSEQVALEADLALAREAPASDDLLTRVLADAATVAASRAREPAAAPAERGRWRILERLDGMSPFWRAVGTCAASALIGVFAGYMSPAPIAEAATSMASLELITGDGGAVDGESFELSMNDLEPF